MAFAEYHRAVKRLMALRNMEIPWEHQSPKGLRDSMERLRQLLRRLGNPEKKMQFIHVPGTSGKGSVTNLVHEMLLADGRRVASNTSPHTTSFLERFHVGDKLIAPHALVKAITTVLTAYQAHLNAGKQPMTFFELLTATAFVAFTDAKVEWCVLEVGLGGRWDSTNVIPAPAVAIITNIDLDHTHVLGKTRQKIAHEKAGIIKRGSHVITGEPRRPIRAIFAKEAAKADATIEYVRAEGDDHRLHNALIATRAALAVGVPLATIEKALQQHRSLPCRLEVIQDKPRVIIDGAHNDAKMATTVARVRTMAKKGKIHVIFGCKEGKDSQSMTKGLSTIATTIRTTRYEDGAGSPQNPYQLLARIPAKLRSGAFLFPHDALNDALAAAKPTDTILITGSLYLAGELRTHWVSEEQILRRKKSELS